VREDHYAACDTCATVLYKTADYVVTGRARYVSERGVMQIAAAANEALFPPQDRPQKYCLSSTSRLTTQDREFPGFRILVRVLETFILPRAFTCKQQEKYTNYLQTTILIDSVSFEPTEPSPHPTGVPIGATRPPALFEVIIVFGLGFFHEVEPRYQRLGTEK
jgi:hypothetical protein